MAAIVLRARSQLVGRRQGWLGLAILIGLLGGIVIALAAGARRTDSAFGRLAEAEQPLSISVVDRGFSGGIDTPPDFLEQVARLPEVAEARPIGGIVVLRGETQDGQVIGEPDYLQTIAVLDRGGAEALARQKLVAGRHFNPERADETVIGFTLAERYDIEAGEDITLISVPAAELGSGSFDEDAPGDPLRFLVVGITAAAGEFPPRSFGDGAGTAFLPPAAAERYQRYQAGQGLGIRLDDEGRDLAAFQRSVERLAGGAAFDAVGGVGSSARERTIDALHLLAQALWLLAGLGALTGALIVGQAVARQSFLASQDDGTLRALGMTNGRLAAVGAVRGLGLGAVALAVAVAVAVTASPLFPLGLARTAEPDPGLHVDAFAIALGAGGLAALVVGLAAVTAWWAARRHEAPETQVGRVAARVSDLPLPASLATGIRLALVPGRGRTSLPVRSTIAGAATGLLALAGALTFASGLDHLLATPGLYGWNWDLAVGDGYSPNGEDLHDDIVPALEGIEGVDEIATGTLAIVETEGSRMMAMGLDPVRGSIGPSLIEGRVPQGPDEALLGGETSDDLGVGIGDEVEVRLLANFEGGRPEGAARAARYRVVGRGVLPQQSDEGLDEGITTTYAGLARLGERFLPRNFFPLRFAPRVDHDDGFDRVADAVPHYVVDTQEPSDLVNFGRVEQLPRVAGGLMASVAAAMLGHALLTSIRRRRRDLAVLKTVGFESRQVGWVVAAQATVLAVSAAAAGLPIGVAAGRWLWTVVAERLGVVAEPVVPLFAVAMVVPATLIAANVVAAVPARLAARTPAATVLRAE